MGKKDKAPAPAVAADEAADVTMAEASSPSKKSKKDKEEKEFKTIPAEFLSPIAKPLAGKKTSKHVLKLVKKASKSRHLKRGVKEVVKSVRKGEKGILVLAADISPLDILTHIPLLAEEAGCPYIWISSKEFLGLASSTKRPTSCVLIAEKGAVRKLKEGEKPKEGLKEAEKEFEEAYKEVKKEVEELDESVVY